jgi:acyl-CoA synthetase (AMP-forming)/AMP-acid ligase II
MDQVEVNADKKDFHDPKLAATLPELIRAISKTYGDKPAVVLGDEVLTYGQLETRSAELAAWLLSRGVGKATRIGLLYSNSPSWVVAWAAITRIGAVAVPLSTFSKPPELARVIRHADLHALIAQPTFLSQDFERLLEDALPELADQSPELRLTDAPFLRWIVLDTASPPGWALSAVWRDFAEPSSVGLVASAEAEVHADEPAMMIYTSGQSADPKGVIHSHGGIVEKTHYVRDMLGIGSNDENVLTMPLFWVGGLIMTLFPTLEIGGTVHCMEGPTTGGTIVGAVHRTSEVGVLPGARARVGLGMSETFGIYSWGTEAPHPQRPLCTPLSLFAPGVDIKIVDAAGKRVADGGRGEILVRGRTVTLGLHKVARSDSFDADGYYRTGDEGEVDGEVIYFHGRLGDMIKTSGANVSPAEVERELVAIEGVAAAHVVAIDDAARGQVVGAAVVPDVGVELSVAELLQTLRERLSSYKVPTLVAFFRQEELPVTPTYKLRKPILAEMIRERANGDSHDHPS